MKTHRIAAGEYIISTPEGDYTLSKVYVEAYRSTDWFLTYPGDDQPSDCYPTKRDALEAIAS